MRVLFPVITGGYWKKTFPGRWVPPATSTRSCLDMSSGHRCVRPAAIEACGAEGVALVGHCQLCHCLSTMVALVPAASPQLRRTSSLQLRALLCWLGQPGVCISRCQVPNWGCAVTMETAETDGPAISLGVRK